MVAFDVIFVLGKLLKLVELSVILNAIGLSWHHYTDKNRLKLLSLLALLLHIYSVKCQPLRRAVTYMA